MKLHRLALAAAGAGVLAATALSGPALATAQGDPTPSWAGKTATAKSSVAKDSAAVSSGPCNQDVVWPTADNIVKMFEVQAATPPRVMEFQQVLFGVSRYTATWYAAWNASGTQFFAYGLFLQGPNLMRHTTVYPDDGSPTRTTVAKIGGGWTNFKAISTSNYQVAAPAHAYLYGLNTDGKLYRYAKSGTGYKALGSFGGFAGFKAMTVVSETPTYDTLLMTTKAGALYTIHIPITATAKPVVKLVRKSGWSAYESLVTQGCGGTSGGTLVIGVDHDTDAGNQFAFGKFKGTATAMSSYGKIPTVFDGINHASFTSYKDQLSGE
jgi:hypothetical protein